MRTILVALFASAFSSIACAQDAAPASYDGTWAMTAASTDGREFSAELVLKGDGGTWRNYGRRGGAAMKNNPCLMKEFPVTVQKSTADGLTFRVDGSKVIAGCNDFTAELKRVDDKTLDGTMGESWTAHLARK